MSENLKGRNHLEEEEKWRSVSDRQALTQGWTFGLPIKFGNM
jgi:hypothetical protein